MSHHSDVVHKQWDDELLADTRGLVGAVIHFNEGLEYAGGIKKVEDLEGRVRFYLAWCGRKTKHGWTRKQRKYVTLYKSRFEHTGSPDKIRFGDSVIELGDQITVRESDLVAPITHAQRRAMREAKKFEPPATSPDLPLFTAR